MEACIAIARKVQRARQLSGDEARSEAACQVARCIEEELLRIKCIGEKVNLPNQSG